MGSRIGPGPWIGMLIAVGWLGLLVLVVRISMDLASSREGSHEPEDTFEWDEDLAWDR